VFVRPNESAAKPDLVPACDQADIVRELIRNRVVRGRDPATAADVESIRHADQNVARDVVVHVLNAEVGESEVFRRKRNIFSAIERSTKGIDHGWTERI